MHVKTNQQFYSDINRPPFLTYIFDELLMHQIVLSLSLGQSVLISLFLQILDRFT